LDKVFERTVNVHGFGNEEGQKVWRAAKVKKAQLRINILFIYLLQYLNEKSPKSRPAAKLWIKID
jgi:hypothetical protein